VSSDIVNLNNDEQFREAVELQRTIWGFEDDAELLPARFFAVAVKVGGQAFGAYADGKMVAFLLAIPGLKPGGLPYLHSHMLGVLPEYRNSGLGRRLKMHQREDALARGIQVIEWTFDPLQLKNAWFNIEGLGAIARRYVRNQYGISTSALQGGLPTDRLVAEWWIAAERFRPPVLERIRVPDERSKEVQEKMASHFEAAFARGLAVFGIIREPAAVEYLLGNIDSEETA
jgi:predicted GNAT superfamily acetyltransferase